MLVTVFLQFRPEGHREPRDDVGSVFNREPSNYACNAQTHWATLPLLLAQLRLVIPLMVWR